ncbi:MAG: helix-turn-helix domain-containing protein [Nitrososphaerota archaeon]|nr:helix-turn-helix domain-containing protein [Nitrososphaerota archaeon]
MKTASRFRLYPDCEQEREPLGMVEAGRRLWNGALTRPKWRREEQPLSMSYGQQRRMLAAEAGPCGEGCPRVQGQGLGRRGDLFHNQGPRRRRSAVTRTSGIGGGRQPS